MCTSKCKQFVRRKGATADTKAKTVDSYLADGKPAGLFKITLIVPSTAEGMRAYATIDDDDGRSAAGSKESGMDIVQIKEMQD